MSLAHLINEYAVAPLPAEEELRLQVLDSYQILDSEDEQSYDDLTHLASVLCDTPTALITLLDKERQWVKSSVNWAKRQEARDVSFCSHAILRPGELMQVRNTLEDPRFKRNPLVTGTSRVRFYAGVPLVTREGTALGTICVLDRKARVMSFAQEQALKCLARQVVAQLELRVSVRELEQESLTDPLTGAWNRRAFHRLLREIWAKHSRTGAGLGLLMIDIDHFKSINDRFGHPEGDLILKQVSKLLADNLRPSDRLIRYGGEEFCCVLEDYDLDSATIIAERARVAVQSAPWVNQAITVSIGVSGASPEDEPTPNLLIARADSALYQAKRSGRNKVQVFESEAMPPYSETILEMPTLQRESWQDLPVSA